jgi:predicted metalloprotease
MDWGKGRESDNVEEDSGGGQGGSGGGGMRFGGLHIGIGGTIVLAIVAMVFPQTRPMIMGLFGGGQSTSSVPTQGQPANLATPQDEFVSRVLGSTEDVWGAYFQAKGVRYERPKLLLFHGQTNSGCGAAQAASGPFYCPTDHRVYLDLDFFRQMDTRFHASGDFARAYVIAHEVGHHVQNLMGTMRKEEELHQKGMPMDGANGLSVRIELQADCYAGVWGNRSQQQLQWLQPGDIDAALNAASQVGDDTLQKAEQGYAVPDSFTHGTAAQRSHWFKAGFVSGDVASCDTFSAAKL